MKSYYFGIKTNNLKNIDISFTNKKIILFSGPSGSGKSSLAVDTIHKISEDELYQLMNMKDGKTVYSLSDYENILPSICLQQENYNSNPRSTIATYFNIDKYFKESFSIKNCVSQKFFQFNTQPGGCIQCSGTGLSIVPDQLKIVDFSEKISNKPFKNWRNSKSDFYHKILMCFCSDNNIDVSQKFFDLNEREKGLLLSSESESKYKIGFKSNKRKHTKTSKYKGPLFELRENINKNSISASQKKYLSEDICEKCNGTRFSADISNFQVYGKNIGELYMMEFDLLIDWIEDHKEEWTQSHIVKRAFGNIESFLRSILKLNLDYLNLNRSIPTLSGGELQRLRLAKALNSQFFNFLYVLDEPTSGLHPSEWSMISKIIFDLKKMGNTVLIIEHNEFLQRIADTTIYLGPGGGKEGGKIVRKEDIKKSKEVLKYKFFEPSKFIDVNNVSYNNVKNITISVPVKSLIGVCGTSGSGKSSFLYGILPRYLNDVVYLNQSPIRGNYYSIVATAIGIFNYIQKLYSKTNNVSKDFFTYISKGKGQCNACQGKGFLKEESSFIETEILCPSCEGKRFSKSGLKYKFKGMNIHELLSLSVDELSTLIEDDDKVFKILNFTNALGMGYLNLFQNVSNLSGGEAQRVKLLKSLFGFSTKRTFLLDEPFRGVDNDNIKNMLLVFYDLVERGYTIYIAEHNILAINYCSYIIEFGPKSGKYGGKIIFYDQRKHISKSKTSMIGSYLPDFP